MILSAGGMEKCVSRLSGDPALVPIHQLPLASLATALAALGRAHRCVPDDDVSGGGMWSPAEHPANPRRSSGTVSNATILVAGTPHPQSGRWGSVNRPHACQNRSVNLHSARDRGERSPRLLAVPTKCAAAIWRSITSIIGGPITSSQLRDSAAFPTETTTFNSEMIQQSSFAVRPRVPRDGPVSVRAPRH
jgi:hypothetical protein